LLLANRWRAQPHRRALSGCAGSIRYVASSGQRAI